MNITGTELTLSRDEERTSICTSLASFELSVESAYDDATFSESLALHNLPNSKAEMRLRSLHSDSNQSGRWLSINDIDATVQVFRIY